MEEKIVYVKANDGKHVKFSNKPQPFTGTYYGAPVPVMERDETRANQEITVGDYILRYDELGYCIARLNK